MRGPEFCLLVPAVLSLEELRTCPGPSLSSVAVWQHGLLRGFRLGSEFVVLEVSSFQATCFIRCRVKALEQSMEHAEELCAGQGDLVSPSLPVSAAPGLRLGIVELIFRLEKGIIT